MQKFSVDQVKDTLFSTIDSILDDRNDFLMDPRSDFSRTKKISFMQTILFPMIAGSDNVDSELMDLFPEDKLPNPSAMIQRRNQVKPSAYKNLFSRFTQAVPVTRTFHGFRLLAVDGSRLNLPYNPSDPDTFIQAIKGRRGINQLHLNALYDILNDLIIEVELQGIHEMNEKEAFCRLMMRHEDPALKSIFLGDRGYASYNIFAHAAHNSQLFLIRVPESFAFAMCTDRDQWLQKDNEDNEIRIHIGRNRKKRSFQKENYHCIPKRGHYDFIEAGSNETDHLALRVVKFPVSDGSFEYIVTNLSKHRFSAAMIKELYRLRWGIETAFRYLKYAANMVHIHSRKKELLLQEIYGKLTLYNFSSFMAMAAKPEQPQSARKYDYVINHTQLIKICIRFLRGSIQNAVELIRKKTVPIRLGRKFPRNLRRQSADTFTYR